MDSCYLQVSSAKSHLKIDYELRGDRKVTNGCCRLYGRCYSVFLFMFNKLVQNDFLLISSSGLQELAPFFNNIPSDPYYGSYRFKAISRFTVIDGQVTLLPLQGYIQSKEYNPIAGDVVRHYPAINKNLTSHSELLNLLRLASEKTQSPDSAVYTLHQMRVVSSEGQKGLAAAEGIHRDGYDYILICCIARHNIEGGVTSLYSGKTESEKVFEKQLLPGDIVFAKDSMLYHYTTPIHHLGDDDGYRDVLVVTISQAGLRDVPVD